MPTELPPAKVGAPSWRVIIRGYLAVVVLSYRVRKLRRHVLAAERVRRKIDGARGKLGRKRTRF